MRCRVTLIEAPEGFTAWTHDLPGCITEGDTREEALKNLRCAIGEYIEAQQEVRAQFGTAISHVELTV